MNFQEQNKELFENFLNRNYFNEPIDGRLPSFEFILTSDCDLKCKYCYIKEHEDVVYPKSIRHPKTILKNAEIYLNFLFEKNNAFNLDLFSGEPLSQKIGFDFLELVYSKALENPNKLMFISIPTNMNFLLSKEKTEHVESLINRFKEINVRLSLSASIDGKYLAENRPFVGSKEEQRDEEFYDNLFQFCKKYNYGFHPMVSAYSIDKWIENYSWYMEMMSKYDIRRPNGCLAQPMMLEVRNDDWNDEKITHYLKFLDHVINWRLEELNYDIKEFASFIFIKPHYTNYDNISFNYFLGKGDKIGCAIQNPLAVRMGDLSMVPCHRLMYNQFIYGKFVKNEEDTKIVDIEAKNINLAFTIKNTLSCNQPACSECSLKHICGKGCLGSQFESTKELFTPIPSVCKLYKEKFKFLIKRYTELGVMNYMEEVLTNNPESLKIIKDLEKEVFDEKF